MKKLIVALSASILLAFQGNAAATTFYSLSSPTAAVSPAHTDAHEFIPLRVTNIYPVNLTIDGASRKYIAYDCNPGGSEIRLYYSDTILGPWTPYSGNPILQGGGNIYRWPSPVWDGTQIQMIINDELNHKLERWTSSDGITFTQQSTMTVSPETAFMNPFVWKNPNDNLWYMYWKEHASPRVLHVRSATTVDGLDTASDSTVATDTTLSPGTVAAPFVFWDGSQYWLITEVNLGSGSDNWACNAYSSSSPTSGFTRSSDSPIVTNNEAVCIPFWDETMNQAWLSVSREVNSESAWYSDLRQIQIPILTTGVKIHGGVKINGGVTLD